MTPGWVVRSVGGSAPHPALHHRRTLGYVNFCLDSGVHLGAQDSVRVLVAYAAGQPVVRAVIAGQTVARVVNGDPVQELLGVAGIGALVAEPQLTPAGARAAIGVPLVVGLNGRLLRVRGKSQAGHEVCG
jgi:hypothetical protein